MLDGLSPELLGAFSLPLVILQGGAAFVLLSRLLKGAVRHPPLTPQASAPEQAGLVTVVVPTLNEADRIEPCLTGLSRQDEAVREILIVDSRSTDGTGAKVLAIAKQDSRFRLLTDDPLPKDWVGRPWALNYGFRQSSPESRWILGIDADTQPQPGLVGSLLKLAENGDYDLITLSPQFILESAGEWWLQPALLMTLLYRFDVAGAKQLNPATVMANGQCFFCRRSLLEKMDGYSSAKNSFCDDVTLARNIAKAGYKVGFFDGAKVIRVRMYEGAWETWQEWGRSLDLKDAATSTQLNLELFTLTLTQGLPIPLLMILFGVLEEGARGLYFFSLLGVNSFLVLLRFAMLLAIYPSYFRQSKITSAWLFWLSPFADPLAVLRIFLSAQNKPTQWRGRTY